MSQIYKPKKHYTQISNSIIYDPEISCKALGLYTYMIAKPDNWDFSAERIATEKKDGRDAIQSGLRELIEHKYLLRIKKSDGTVAYVMFNTSLEYDEFATEHNIPQKPKQENPSEGISLRGKSPLIYKKEVLKKQRGSKETLNQKINKKLETEKQEPNFEHPLLADATFATVWSDFCSMRKQNRIPLTEKATALTFKKFDGVDVPTAIAMVEQSIEMNYRGIFPLKQSYQNAQKIPGKWMPAPVPLTPSLRTPVETGDTLGMVVSGFKRRSE